ncbi:MAG: flagellar basal body protein, partial [Rubrivivax sp.]
MLDKLTSSMDFHAKALVLRSERQRVIASNIANADTPGYAARDMSFADAMRDASSNFGGGATGATGASGG